MTKTRRTSRDGITSVTVEDVAKVAGVSRATVSRVVNGSPRVSPEAKAAVMAAIDQLGYVPNRAARSLMTRRSDSVGVIIIESGERLFGDPYFGQLMVGISTELSEREIQLVVLMAQTPRELAGIGQYVAAGRVDGAILVNPHREDSLPERLVRGGVPIVLSGRPPSGSSVSYVDADNRTGARTAVTHLIGIGRRSIATIHGALGLTSAEDRLDGYRDALVGAGIPRDPTLEAAGDYNPPTAAKAMQALLDRHPGLDGVFAASDSMADAAIRVIRDSGRRVPQDVAVVGFDDSPVALLTRPTLSTIRQPTIAMGREMARLVLERIGHPDEAARQVVFATELVVRESSGPRPDHDKQAASPRADLAERLA
jgi:DNA-binding LacI/PurR family transcriptional regulator